MIDKTENLTDKGFLSDESDAQECPVCGGEIEYEPKGNNWGWDHYGFIFMSITCPHCKSRLSASFDYHDVQVDSDGRFEKEG